MTDLRIPPREACVLRYVLDGWADRKPDSVFAEFFNGPSITYGEMHRQVIHTAAHLATLGVRQGDHVLTWLPNGPEAMRLWFAINYLGAIYVPMNTAYKGKLLAHAIWLSDAKLIVLHAGLADRLRDVDTAKLNSAVLVGGEPSEIGSLTTMSSEHLFASCDDGSVQARVDLEHPIEPWDTQSIIFTSGTTGPSKAVLQSYMQLAALSGEQSWAWLKPDDRFMVNLPLFHVGGTCCTYGPLLRGGSVAVVEGFDTTSFWSSIKATGTTVVALMGAMTPFLVKAPPSAADRDHGLRIAIIIPLAGDVEEFSRRFGVEVYTVFNMTEISTPLVSDPNPKLLGTSGKPRSGVEVRLVDENDCEVAVGSVGEMILRTDAPWAMTHGYHKNPEATARAWRNGWFHTGDAFRRDEDNNFFFVDRQKDAIRRRGENISSFEVEVEALAHPDIREAAAIPVPSDLTEDEVMLVVAPNQGAEIDYVALIEFLAHRLPHFMVPRYVRVIDELPKTPTAKVQKHLLRAEGVTIATFDRETVGLRIKRESLRS